MFRFQPGPKGGHKPSAPTHIPGTPDVADLRKQVKQQKPVVRMAKSKAVESEEEEEESARNAAWRWRFNRRWRTEQVKQAAKMMSSQTSRPPGASTVLPGAFTVSSTLTYGLPAGITYYASWVDILLQD